MELLIVLRSEPGERYISHKKHILPTRLYMYSDFLVKKPSYQPVHSLDCIGPYICMNPIGMAFTSVYLDVEGLFRRFLLVKRGKASYMLYHGESLYVLSPSRNKSRKLIL